jgi:hypothetical protein
MYYNNTERVCCQPIITVLAPFDPVDPQDIASPFRCAGLLLTNTVADPAEAVASCGGDPGHE